MEEMIMVYITNPSKDRAEELAKHLLTRRLIACANVFELDNIYWSDGFVEKDSEFILIAKTVEENFSAVRKIAEDTSDYQVPCVIKMPVTANQQYVQWLRSEIKI
jgi:periplasmic divalent cation tolerance protein